MLKYLFLFLITSSAALAHSWYPWRCCYDNHCSKVPCEDILEVEKGYKYLQHFLDKAEPSLDKFCHACIDNGKLTCLFIQLTN